MVKFILNKRSENSLVGVHPDLVHVVRNAAYLHGVDGWAEKFGGFVVIEGLRTQARQAQLVKAGASWTMNSRHLTGHAVDLAVYINGPSDIRWEWKLYEHLYELMRDASKNCNIPIEWGGKWKVRDGPHFQLPRTLYT